MAAGLVLLSPLWGQRVSAGELALLDPGAGIPVRAHATRVSVVERDGRKVLHLETARGDPWPGITVPAPGGRWDLSSFGRVVAELWNPGAGQVTVSCRVDNRGADGTRNCLTESLALGPGKAGTLTVPLRWKGGKDLFGMRGYPAARDPKGIDPEAVIQVLLFLPKPSSEHVIEVAALRAEGEPPVSHEPFFPCIDRFGQYLHAEWPGKVHSEDDLRRRREEEDRELGERPGPPAWDRFGGWAGGPTLSATGSFRVEKREGSWWVVDPEGRLFFSHGVDCVRMLDVTPVQDRQSWFTEPPGDGPEFREFLHPATALLGYYAGKNPPSFSFAGANLKRKHGEGWARASAAAAHRRMRSWGLNTVGNWSDASMTSPAITPYVTTLHSGGKVLEGSEGYWGKFADVFDPSFEAETRRTIGEGARGTAGDPFCIGYFVDNELSWGDELSLALAALKSPADSSAKRAFLEDLKARYGTVERLNEAWGSRHRSWEALLESRASPDRQKALKDLEAFTRRTAERYFAVVKAALAAAAPAKLYLGCRFAWTNDVAVRAAAVSCDVISFNLYRRSVSDFRLPEGVDRPVMIGEFHFGALDRGLFHTGLVPVRDQAERAQAYREYVEGALRHPAIVGCHWFQWQDEPTTGRAYDEENYQIGLVDVTDTPYPETIDACRQVGAAMYAIRSGTPARDGEPASAKKNR